LNVLFSASQAFLQAAQSDLPFSFPPAKGQ